MPHDDKAINEMMSGLIGPDRLVGALTIALIAHDPEAKAVVQRMLTATTCMARGLAAPDRYMIAERMRDAADAIERLET